MYKAMTMLSSRSSSTAIINARYCAMAQPIVKQIQARLGPRLRLVFRHFPLTEVHPLAGSGGRDRRICRQPRAFLADA